MLQDNSTQVLVIPEGLQSAQFSPDNLSLLASHLIAVVVVTCCTILLFRTASGMQNSRFLKHLAFSIFLNVPIRMIIIVSLVMKGGLALWVFTKLNEPKYQDVITQIAAFVTTVDSVVQGSDIIISLLSTLFMFASWDLLRRYPNQGVRKSFYTALTAIFGTGSLLAVLSILLTVAEKFQTNLWWLLRTLDVWSAALGLILVGWQIQKTLGAKMKNKNPVLQATLPWMTAMAYFIWGGTQPFYHLLKDYPWYSSSILICGLSAILLTVILCSQALDEKPEYITAFSKEDMQKFPIPPIDL